MTEQTEEHATTNGYPQLNLNTGISISAVALLIGMVVWTTGIKSDLGQSQATITYHEQRITSVEATGKELRTAIDNARYLQAQSEIKLEGRLVGIEGLLRDVINRLAMAERERRGGSPQP
jgi:hypothetical protein